MQVTNETLTPSSAGIRVPQGAIKETKMTSITLRDAEHSQQSLVATAAGKDE